MEANPKNEDLPRALMAFVLAAAFVAAAAAAYQMVEGYFTGPSLATEPIRPYIVAKPLHPATRLFLFIVDGLPESVAFTPGRLPFVDTLRARGAWGVSLAAHVTMTTTCVRTIGTGYEPPLMDVMKTFDAPPVRDDNLFRRLAAGRRHIVFAGDASWSQLFGEWAGDKLALPDRGISDKTESDERAEKFALQHCAAAAPDVLIAHFVGSDHEGHTTGTQSEAYAAKLKEIDGRIAHLLRASDVNDWDYVLVMADHGATVTGNHGGGEDVARRAPFVLVGPQVRAGGPYETDHRAWAATFAYVLEVGLAERAERGPAWQFLTASEKDRREWDERVLASRRRALSRMGASEADANSASTPEELDALRDRVTGARPVDLAYGVGSVAALLLMLVALCSAAAAGSRGGTWMILGVTVAVAAALLVTGGWRQGLLAGLLGALGLVSQVRDPRRAWVFRVGPPWIAGVIACAVLSRATAGTWRALQEGGYSSFVRLSVSAIVLGVPLVFVPGRLGRLMREGGLGLSIVAVGIAIPAVWCYWLSHRAIYAVVGGLALVSLSWTLGPRALRPFLPLAGMIGWAFLADSGEAVSRVAQAGWTVALGGVLCLPLLVAWVRATHVPTCVLALLYLLMGFAYRIFNFEQYASAMLLLAIPVAWATCMNSRDAASRRRALLLWGLALFRVLAKDHQFVTFALFAWLLDELAERLSARPAPVPLVVGVLVALDLLQFHMLGSVYTFSTVDVTTGFVGTASGLDLPRTVSMVFLRYAIPLFALSLVPPVAVRNRVLAFFGLCLLSRCLYLLMLFPWKRSDYWWVASAGPGVIFTAFQVGIWFLAACVSSFVPPRRPAEGLA